MIYGDTYSGFQRCARMAAARDLNVMESLRQTPVVRFGTFEVSFASNEIRKAGVKIRVQQQPLKLLEILLERPGEVVTREELRSRIWAGENFGDFDQAVNIAIAKLRSALGDLAESPRYIETLPKRGYRFIAEVSVVDTAGHANTPESAPGDTTGIEPGLPDQGVALTVAHKPWLTPTRRAVVVTVAVLSLAILAIWLFRSRERPLAGIRSIAVLPLDNLSGNPSQDYFSDGMTDELITDLAKIKALRVISRNSVMGYKGTHPHLPEIARQLNVEAVVEGSVLRVGDRVRITAQLIQVPADRHLWAESYEGNLSDTLALQNNVAQAIAEQIRIEVTPQEQAALKSVKTIDPATYEDYLKGRYFWSKRTADGLKKAVDYFNLAIAREPNYAAAYSGLADTYALLGDWQYAVMPTKEAVPRAKAAALKALELDDTLSEAHNSLGFCLDGFDWNFAAADREFRRAIELNPGYASAHHWYAWHLALLGRNDDALTEMRKAASLDPLSLNINSDLAELLLIAHFPDESIQQSRKTIDMDPGFSAAHNQLGQGYIAKHMYAEAIAELQKAIKLSGDSPIFTANLARAYVAANRKADAVELLNDLKRSSVPGYPLAAEIAMIYTALGDKDHAMTWLEKGYEERFNPGVLLRSCFDPIRSDPRFKDLVRRIGLPS
jgi:TolB-like protein/DNA-binding winged helix-turn-helix (wHTH) protein/Flp pilus assembly protein TadD